ncbi:hypothetical protein ACQF36_38485 [Streptomyces sp. Marseille-Q5077]|uniref:hypothetical protein n=1 Tax=Streptomyces sp. Marseille-Q5077 TaxID=3418995 RepID=UPI003D013539
MSQGPQRPAPALLPTLVTAGISLAVWAAWLGWDQHRDIQPDGTTTGPYEAWQVIGLALTLLMPVYWAASRHHRTAAVVGPTIGLTVAAFHDWSDDASGLYMIGVVMVMLGSLAATATVSAVIGAMSRDGRQAAH